MVQQSQTIAPPPESVRPQGVVLSLRSYLIIFTAILALGALSTLWLAHNEDAQLRSDLLLQAGLIAAGIDFNVFDDLRGNPSDVSLPAYQRLKTQLMAYRAVNPMCRFIYITGMQGNGDIFFFLDSEPADSQDHSPPGQIYQEVSDNFKTVFTGGKPSVEGPIPDRWGTWVSALFPLVDPRTEKTIAVLGMDVDARNWTKSILIHCAPAVTTTVFLLTLLTIVFILFRRAENARLKIAESEPRLSQSERAYRSVVTNMIDVFFRVNTDNEFVLLSPSAAVLLGYENTQALIGQSADCVWADPLRLKDMFADLLAEGSVKDYEMQA